MDIHLAPDNIGTKWNKYEFANYAFKETEFVPFQKIFTPTFGIKKFTHSEV